jgi:hypothetical protein
MRARRATSVTPARARLRHNSRRIHVARRPADRAGATGAFRAPARPRRPRNSAHDPIPTPARGTSSGHRQPHRSRRTAPPARVHRHLGQQVPPARARRSGAGRGSRTPASRASPGRSPGSRPRRNCASTGPPGSCTPCAGARSPRDASCPTPGPRSTSPPPPPSTAPCPEPSAIPWTTSWARSTRRGSRSRPAAASATSSPRCDRAAPGSPAPAPRRPGPCPSWTSTTACASPSPPRAGAAAPRWPPSTWAIRTSSSSSAPSARTGACASSTCPC